MRLFGHAALAVLGLLVLGAPGGAAAHGGDVSLVHACASLLRGGQGGQLRLVAPAESCRPGETAVDWPGSIGDQPPPTVPPRFVIRDANGAEVGAFAGMPLSATQPLVHATAGGRTFVLLVHKTRLLGAGESILFDGNECQGNPYVTATSPPVQTGLNNLPLAITRDASPGPQVYVTAADGGAPQLVDIRSSLPPYTGPCDDTDQDVLSVVPLDVFTLPFVGPFSGQYE